jgi:hypothetical protein
MHLLRLRDVLLLNIILAVFYAAFCIVLGVRGDRAQMMVPGDAHSYEAVADWIAGGPTSDWLGIRPVVYPSLIALCKLIGGYEALWALQVLMWAAANNLLFATLYLVLQRRWLAFGCTLLMGLSLSLAASTVFMLTETFAVLLGSLICWYSVKHRRVLAEGVHPINLAGLLVMLTLVKPQTLYLLVVLLPFVLWGLIRSWRASHAFRLALFLAPLVVQATIVHHVSGEGGISRIGPITVRDYLFSQGLAEIEKVPYKTAVEHARAMSADERSAFMREHASVFLGVYFRNLGGNLSVGSFALPILNGTKNIKFRTLLYYVPALFGYLLLGLHIVMLVPLGWVIIRSWYGSDEDRFWLIILTGLLLLGTLPTGISYWQGDRLVLPATPFYLVLYVFTIKEVVKAIRTNPGEPLA